MGLFVGSDGSYRGWLAALLSCTMFNSDEELTAKRLDRAATTPNDIWHEQPIPLKPLHTSAVSSATLVGNEAGFIHRHNNLSVPDRPPTLKPLDFGDASLMGLTFAPAGHKASKSNVKRLNIGQPTAFRRLEYTEAQRRSLIPLQLEPVTLRDSILRSGIDHGINIESKEIPTSTETSSASSAYHARHSPKSQSWTRGPTVDLGDIPQASRERQTRRPTLSSYSSSSSIRSLRRQALESLSSSSSSSPHSSIDWGRLNRKRNSLRKPSSDSMEPDVEQEVMELNTIVEEKRSDSSRSRSSDGHVSAVAPLMSIRARSETLNDIGSAFSRPKPYHMDHEARRGIKSGLEADTVLPMEKRLSRPFAAMPERIATPEPAERKAHSMIGGWLNNIIGSTSKPARRTREEFYSCKPYHQRALSESSTAVSEITSSPWSTAHNRTITADSIMTPPSTAPSTGRGLLEMEHLTRGSIRWVHDGANHSEVGLAL